MIAPANRATAEISRSAQPADPRRRLKILTLVLIASALVLLAALRMLDLSERRTETLTTAEHRVGDLSFVASEHLRSTVAAVDAVMRQLSASSRQLGGPSGDPARWNVILGVSRPRLNGVGSFSIVDKEGVIRHTTSSRLLGDSRHETPIFGTLAGQSRDLLVAGAPYSSTTTPGLMLMPLGRRLTTPTGEFDGMIWATFRPHEVRSFFRTLDVGARGSISVFHPDGHVIFHQSAAGDSIGKSAVGHPLFEAAAKAPTRMTARVKFPSDGSVRLAGFGRSGDSRLLVVATLDQDELLSDWRHEARISIAAFTLAIATLACGLRILFRQFDARTAAEQALARSRRLEAIGQLTGSVAHDFNNLLTVILMNSALMKLERDSSPALNQIEGAAQRAAHLTRQLLTFAGRQSLQPKLVDLNEVLKAFEPMLGRVLGEDITLSLSLTRECCRASIDPVQVESAVLNLCVNARDAMPQGGLLQIESRFVTFDAAAARANRDVTPGRYVMVAVSDTGMGIAAEHLTRVFEPFFTTKEIGKGTGLGLSSVYGFVHQSGGHVKIESEVGRGTVVRLYFPAAEQAATEVVITREQTGRGKGESILLVEDETDVRELAAMTLQRYGYRVCAVANGSEAIAIARSEHPIDLLLTDVVLPGGMNGHRIAETIAKLRPGLRVLYSSGYSDEIVHGRGEIAAGLRLINKPYAPDQLAHAVRAALEAPESSFVNGVAV